MEENHEIYKKRAVKNIFVLIFRSGLLYVVNFGGNFILTIILGLQTFGVYILISALVNFLNYFSDIGFAAALVQKKEAVEDDELKGIFTIQQILVLTFCAVAIIISPMIKNFYGLDSHAMWLFYACLVSFFLSSLKTIPSVLLERELHFEKMVPVQVIEALFFNVTAIILALLHYEVLAFAWAVFTRAIAGLIAIYIVKPWRIGFNLNFNKFKKHLKFGVPFQMNSFLAMIKDDLLTIILGKILPLSTLALIGWGQKWAFMPLRFILDNVAKIAFSALSRIQGDKEKLGLAVNKAIFGTSFLTFPILTIINVAAQFLVVAVPRYQKWIPALPFLAFFSLNAAMACVFITLVNLLNSVGKVKLTLKLMFFWTALSWILNLSLIYLVGSIGVGIASLLMGFASLVVIYFARQIIKIDHTSYIYPAFSAGIVTLGSYQLLPYVGKTYINMFIVCFLMGVAYLLTSILLFRKKLFNEIKFLRTSL